MRLKIENVTNNTTKSSLRRDRNEIIKTIDRNMKKLDEQKLENRFKEIENSDNNFSRMFRVIKEIQCQKPKILLLIKTNTQEDLLLTRKNRLKLLQSTFKKQFSTNTQVLNKIHSQPTAIDHLFTAKYQKQGSIPQN